MIWWILYFAVGWASHHYFGWGGVALVMVALVAASIEGALGLRGVLRDEGYTVEYRPDMAGRYRWRIGTTRSNGLVTWHSPKRDVVAETALAELSVELPEIMDAKMHAAIAKRLTDIGRNGRTP